MKETGSLGFPGWPASLAKEMANAKFTERLLQADKTEIGRAGNPNVLI